MWSIIVNRPHTSTKIIDGVESTKSKKEWDEIDKKMAQLNAKAMNVLYCALMLMNLIIFQHACQLKKYGIN